MTQRVGSGRYISATVALFSLALLTKAPVVHADTTVQTATDTNMVVTATDDQQRASDTATSSAANNEGTVKTTADSAAASSSGTRGSDSTTAVSQAVTTHQATAKATSVSAQKQAPVADSAAAASATSSQPAVAQSASTGVSSSAVTRPSQTARVTVNYLNQRTSRTIQSSQVLTGAVGQPYDATEAAVTIPGYTLTNQSAKMTGTYDTDRAIDLVYAPKRVSVTVKGYFYEPEDPTVLNLWDSYTRTGYVGDQMTVAAADYSEDELALKPGSATTQAMTLGATNNVVKFYYVDTEDYDDEADYDDSDVAVDTEYKQFKQLIVATASADQQLMTVAGNFDQQAAALLVSDPETHDKTYLIVDKKGGFKLDGLKAGMNTVTLNGATYQLTWNNQLVTVYRHVGNGRLMGFEVDAQTGAILNLYVTSQSASGQWQVWQRDYRADTTQAYPVTTGQLRQMMTGASVATTVKADQMSSRVQGMQDRAKQAGIKHPVTLPQTNERSTGRWALVGGLLLTVTGIVWLESRRH